MFVAIAEVAVRVVSQSDPLWRRGGIGSGDVAAVMGVPASKNEGHLVVFARKVQMRDNQELRMRIVPELEQGTPEWHDFRKLGVGGSEVSVLTGFQKFKTVTDLWREKVEPPVTEVSAENEDIARGKRDEPAARSLYSQLFGWPVEPLCVIHDEFDYVRCSLDGIRGDHDLIIEAKCPRPAGHKKNLAVSRETDPVLRQSYFFEAAPWYAAQTQYQLLITGASVCHFVSYCGIWQNPHEKLVVIDIHPDEGYQAELLNRVHEFWGFVERRELPPVGAFPRF